MIELKHKIILYFKHGGVNVCIVFFYCREGGWNELLDLQAQESFEKCGFYAMDVKSNLRVRVTKILKIGLTRLTHTLCRSWR